ncbi:MAG: Hint domain-containing protein [Roseobacter sp.]
MSPYSQQKNALSANNRAVNAGLPMGSTPLPKPAFGVRIADVTALKDDGSIVIGQRKIPTLPEFDQVFAAFAQGTLFQSDNGLVAVEDLQPGDRLMTASGQCEQVTWIGSCAFAASDMGARIHMTRIMPDSFGMNRPESFVSLGPAARVLHTPPDMRNTASPSQMMSPAQRFVDGVNVIDVLPPTTVRLFHVGLRKHSALIAGGLEVESYFPEAAPLKNLSHTLRSVFISLFPHINDLGDLGNAMYARAPKDHEQSAA